jgi:Putative Actinobacterial Holin-X, holin superfamily III
VGIPATSAAPSEQDSLGTLITRLGVDLGRIVRAEAGLLGMRLVATVDILRTATIGLVAGVVLASTGFGMTMLAVFFLLARWLPPWAAALLVGVVLLGLGVAFTMAAVGNSARDVTAALTTNRVETHPL